LQDADSTRVVVVLRAPTAATISAQTAQVAQSQADVLNNIRESEFQLTYRYRTVPGLVGEVTAQGLARLNRNEAVIAVAPDMPVTAATADSAQVIHADRVWNELGITGAGVTVAVLDSGVDLAHPDLADHVLAQHCFTHAACAPNNKDEGDSAQDEHGHGTRVAGIISGKGTASPKGIAPDAGLVVVRVLDRNANGWTSDIVAGIEWVTAQQVSLDVKIINLSLGGGRYTGSCADTDANTMLFAAAIKAARAAGIVVFAAAGNQSYPEEMSAPACVPAAVTVGATYDAALGLRNWNVCAEATTAVDQVACFSNSSSMLDVLAPGAWIESATLGGGQRGDAGTSMATPHVAAVAALLLQVNRFLSPDTLEAQLITTGVPVRDARNGRVTPRVDAFAAVNPLMPKANINISGTVWLQGRATHAGSTVLLSSACGAAAVAATGDMPSAVPDDSGRFVFTLPADHTYRCLTATAPRYLRAQTALPQTSEIGITLSAGDLNGDNEINLLDLTRIAARYGTADTTVDLNGDGKINIQDLALVGGNYGKRGP